MESPNKYINLDRVEFIITDRCSSKCDHCSNPLEKDKGVIDKKSAIEALELASSLYSIKSIMTFGGEPLLYPEITCQIHSKAYELNIPDREIITNAFWSKNEETTNKIAVMLKKSHANNILISVDAFHQKYLPFNQVKKTIMKLLDLDFESIRLNPCWFESSDGDNEYDDKTRMLLKELSELEIGITQGNIMWAEENAVLNFPHNFKRIYNFKGMKCTDLPYTDLPNNITGICLNSDSSIRICNGKKYSVQDFFNFYDPYKDEGVASVLSGGIDQLIENAKKQNVEVKKSGYFSLCELCEDLRKRILFKDGIA